MACGMLPPAGAAAAAATSWSSLLLPVPLPHRSFTCTEHSCRVSCTGQSQRKLPLSAAAQWYKSRGLACCCTSSGSSAEPAALSIPAEVSIAGRRCDQPIRRCLDSVPGALFVVTSIYGYWTGPDVDDGSGSVEAVLQRIV